MVVGFACEDAAHSLQGFMLWTATLFSLNVCNAFFVCLSACLRLSLCGILWEAVEPGETRSFECCAASCALSCFRIQLETSLGLCGGKLVRAYARLWKSSVHPNPSHKSRNPGALRLLFDRISRLAPRSQVDSPDSRRTGIQLILAHRARLVARLSAIGGVGLAWGPGPRSLEEIRRWGECEAKAAAGCGKDSSRDASEEDLAPAGLGPTRAQSRRVRAACRLDRASPPMPRDSTVTTGDSSEHLPQSNSATPPSYEAGCTRRSVASASSEAVPPTFLENDLALTAHGRYSSYTAPEHQA